MAFLRNYQLNFMLLLSGICGTIAFFVLITHTINPKRRKSLLYMEIGAMFLLMADRFCYVYRGDPSTRGFYMVRICNFLLFFLILFLLYAFNYYLNSLFEEISPEEKPPLRLKIADVLVAVGMTLLALSQIFGFYYTFDESNRYHRARFFVISYAIPLAIIILQLSAVIRYFDKLSKKMRVVMLLFTITPLVASIVQIFVYGLSLINISLVGMVVLLYVFTLMESNKTVERAQRLEMKSLKEERQRFRAIFVQTAEALASAIDAKDKYTHGHSRRVAEYSERIARIHGLDNQACEEVYFAALLHDVGKIGVPDAIINKKGKLTDEEFAEIKKHPIIGKQILSSINRSPYLSIGAHYHHERYDGKGYPEGLKGVDIPEIARIIAVADAYDAMTSKRSYRDAIPQQLVREEFVKGLETQFAPDFAKIMIHLIDLDSEYTMKERDEVKNLAGSDSLAFGKYRSDYSDGVLVTEVYAEIRFKSFTDPEALSADCIPTMILFDSLDGMAHEEEKKRKDLVYFEYAEIRLDGKTIRRGARDIKTAISKKLSLKRDELLEKYADGVEYVVRAARYKDHLKLVIDSEIQTIDMIIALPDSTRYSYIGITGEYCNVRDIKVERISERVCEGDIPRIAEEISYIDAPEGDIPNVQVDGWLTAASKGVPIDGKAIISFHSMSLPTARLVWHCPFVKLFCADDGEVNGENYREISIIRSDGESWATDMLAKNAMQATKTEEFPGWEEWKRLNKEGVDCVATISRKGNSITVALENSGIVTHNVTTIDDDVPTIYAALTGDQCAITRIKIS